MALPTPLPALRAVIYARYSSDAQRAESIDSQIRECKTYADRHGYQVLEIYTDEATTGRTAKRPGWMRLIGDITGGLLACDLVLVWKFSRVMRDLDAAGYFEYILRACDVAVESVSEPLDGSPTSRILKGLHYGLADAESISLAGEVTRGLKENAHAAKSTGGKPALGFRVNAEGRFEIEPHGAAAVRLVFTLYAAGHSYREIIAACNAQGYRTAAGKPFGKNSLHDLLRNARYIGRYVYRAWSSKNVRKRHTGRIYRQAEERIEVEGGVPALVDLDTWEAVQRRIAAGQRHYTGGRKAAKDVYLLSGIAYCGLCGARLKIKVKSQTSKGRQLRHCYYQCAAQGKGGCALRGVQRAPLETAVLDAFGLECLERLHDEFSDIQPKQSPPPIWVRRLIIRIHHAFNTVVQIEAINVDHDAQQRFFLRKIIHSNRPYVLTCV